MDLASPAVSGTSVYANGLTEIDAAGDREACRKVYLRTPFFQG